MFDSLKHCIPNDHSNQVTSEYFIKKISLDNSHMTNVLDLGCGKGESRKLFLKYTPKIVWKGLEIEDCPTLESGYQPESYTSQSIYFYDGINIPFASSSFDIVYSNQVFEHVRFPSLVLNEIRRILKKGGYFMGSTSYLEPYHTNQFWNYTPYGWNILIEDAGLKLLELRPGIDSIALIKRQYLGRPPEASAWFSSSPLNEEIDTWGLQKKSRTHQAINYRKIHYCGQFIFLVTKP